MSEEVKYGAVWDGINPLTGQAYKWGDAIYYDAPVAPPPQPAKYMLFHISLAFAQAPDPQVDELGSEVKTKMTAQAVLFPNPPVTMADLGTAQAEFHQAMADANDGGTQLTAAKNAKREALIILLRQLAAYIEAIPGMTPENAMLSGFEVIVPGSHPSMPLVPPVILAVTNLASTKLGLKIKGSPGARNYECRLAVNGGTPVSGGIFSSTYHIELTGLIPGTTYEIQVRALGGRNHASEWSEPVSHMCT